MAEYEFQTEAIRRYNEVSIPPLSAGPITTVIVEACIRHLWLGISQIDPNKPDSIAENQSFKIFSELRSWLCGAPTDDEFAAIDLQVMEDLRPILPSDLFLRMAMTPRSRPNGRPPTRKQLAVKVLELFHAGLPMETAVKNICPCGSSEHGLKCQENLRTGRRDLQNVLKRCGITLPRRAGLKRLSGLSRTMGLVHGLNPRRV